MFWRVERAGQHQLETAGGCGDGAIGAPAGGAYVAESHVVCEPGCLGHHGGVGVDGHHHSTAAVLRHVDVDGHVHAARREDQDARQCEERPMHVSESVT